MKLNKCLFNITREYFNTFKMWINVYIGLYPHSRFFCYLRLFTLYINIEIGKNSC